MDTQDARQQLEQMLREIEGTTRVLLAELDQDQEQEDSSQVEENPSDTDVEVIAVDDHDALLENAADRKAQVVAALARLDDGSYGACIDCGQQIPAARLEVRPEAARCVADQEKAEEAGLA